MGLIWFYSLLVTANSVTERGNSIDNTRRTNAIKSIIVGVFLCPPFSGSCARAIVRLADGLVHRISTPRMATALIRGKINGSSKYIQGAIVMAIIDRSRLCAVNRALSLLFPNQLTLAEYQQLNQQLHGYAAACLDSRNNLNLNQAYYYLKQCLKNGLISGSALERASDELGCLLGILHSHLNLTELQALNQLLMQFIEQCIEVRAAAVMHFKVAFQQVKTSFCVQGGM